MALMSFAPKYGALLVYDNSNIFIQGQKVAAIKQRMSKLQDLGYRIDFEKLVAHVLKYATNKGVRCLDTPVTAYLYGSKVGLEEPIWTNSLLKVNIVCKIISRCHDGKEKGVDMSLSLDLQRDRNAYMAYSHFKLIDEVELTRRHYIVLGGDSDYAMTVKKLLRSSFQVIVAGWKECIAGDYRQMCRDPEVSDRLSILELDDAWEELRWSSPLKDSWEDLEEPSTAAVDVQSSIADSSDTSSLSPAQRLPLPDASSDEAWHFATRKTDKEAKQKNKRYQKTQETGKLARCLLREFCHNYNEGKCRFSHTDLEIKFFKSNGHPFKPKYGYTLNQECTKHPSSASEKAEFCCYRHQDQAVFCTVCGKFKTEGLEHICQTRSKHLFKKGKLLQTYLQKRTGLCPRSIHKEWTSCSCIFDI
jgi:hypothetical protein